MRTGQQKKFSIYYSLTDEQESFFLSDKSFEPFNLLSNLSLLPFIFLDWHSLSSTNGWIVGQLMEKVSSDWEMEENTQKLVCVCVCVRGREREREGGREREDERERKREKGERKRWLSEKCLPPKKWKCLNRSRWNGKTNFIPMSIKRQQSILGMNLFFSGFCRIYCVHNKMLHSKCFFNFIF